MKHSKELDLLMLLFIASSSLASNRAPSIKKPPSRRSQLPMRRLTGGHQEFHSNYHYPSNNSNSNSMHHQQQHQHQHHLAGYSGRLPSSPPSPMIPPPPPPPPLSDNPMETAAPPLPNESNESSPPPPSSVTKEIRESSRDRATRQALNHLCRFLGHASMACCALSPFGYSSFVASFFLLSLRYYVICTYRNGGPKTQHRRRDLDFATTRPDDGNKTRILVILLVVTGARRRLRELEIYEAAKKFAGRIISDALEVKGEKFASLLREFDAKSKFFDAIGASSARISPATSMIAFRDLSLSLLRRAVDFSRSAEGISAIAVLLSTSLTFLSSTRGTFGARVTTSLERPPAAAAAAATGDGNARAAAASEVLKPRYESTMAIAVTKASLAAYLWRFTILSVAVALWQFMAGISGGRAVDGEEVGVVFFCLVGYALSPPIVMSRSESGGWGGGKAFYDPTRRGEKHDSGDALVLTTTLDVSDLWVLSSTKLNAWSVPGVNMFVSAYNYHTISGAGCGKVWRKIVRAMEGREREGGSIVRGEVKGFMRAMRYGGVSDEEERRDREYCDDCFSDGRISIRNVEEVGRTAKLNLRGLLEGADGIVDEGVRRVKFDDDYDLISLLSNISSFVGFGRQGRTSSSSSLASRLIRRDESMLGVVIALNSDDVDADETLRELIEGARTIGAAIVKIGGRGGNCGEGSVELGEYWDGLDEV